MILNNEEEVGDVNNITTETHLYFDDDVRFDRNVVVDGVIWDIATKDGSVVLADTLDAADPQYTLTVINGGEADISTNKLREVLTGQDGTATYVYTDNPDAVSDGNILIKDLTAAEGTVNLDAGGSTLMHEIRAIDSTVSILAGQDNTFDNAITKRSHLTLGAANGRLGMRETVLADGTAAGGTLLYNQEMDTDAGMKAFIKLDENDTDSNASLSLSGASIGSAGNHLLVDIPDAVTLQIPNVGDLYLDAQALIPQKTDTNGSYYDVEIDKADLGFGLTRVVLPVNPKTNEYTAPEVNTEGTGIGDDVTGDYLEHIVDETHSGVLPEDLQTNEGLARRLAELIAADPNYDWSAMFSEEQILAILADPEARGELLSMVSEEEIAQILSDFRGNDAVSGTDKDLAAWIVMNGDPAVWAAEPETELAQKIAGIRSAQKALEGAKLTGDAEAVAEAEAALAALLDTLTDEDIQIILTGYVPSEGTAADAYRDERLEKILGTVSAQGDPEGAGRIWSAIKDTDESGELYTIIKTLLDVQAKEGSSYKAVPDLGALIGTVLTAEEKEALIEQAVSEASMPAEADPAYDDSVSRTLNVVIGTSTGKTDLFNDGTINITVTDSGLKVEDIRSERGDVSITAMNGSILAEGDCEQQIIGKNVTLKASDDIGADDDAFDLQQKDTTPVVTVAVTDGERENGSRTGFIHLDENGSWVMDTVLSYDWVRKDLNDEMMRLDAEAATGSLNINELDGSIGLGTVSAGEDAVLTTNGDLIDFRTEQEKADGKNNIAAGSDAILNAPDGRVGTTDDPLKVSVGGEMTVIDTGDVDLVTDDDLTVTITSEEGVIHVDGAQDLIVNVEGDIIPGGHVTAGGDANVTAKGDITNAPVTAGDEANVAAYGDILNTTVKGDSVSLTADADGDGNGAVGTKDAPILTDTASGNTGSGSLSANGTEVYVTEMSGDLAIGDITSTQGDTVIVAPGNVTDANAGSAVADAAAAQDAASDAQDKADSAQDRADILNDNASALEAEAAQARQDATDARDKADEAEEDASTKEDAAADAERVAQEAEEAAAQAAANGDEDAAEKQALAEAERAIAEEARRKADEARAEADKLDGIADDKDAIADGLETAAEEARADADAAQQAANDAQAAADLAKQAADAAVETANNADQAIETAGNLTIHAGGSVGTNDVPLDTNVGGSLTVGATGDVNIANQGDLNIRDLNADGNAASDRDVTLTAVGDLNSDKIITGGNAKINTLDGNVGSAGKPLKLSADTLSGTISGDGQNTGNGDITNNKSLEIGDLSADGHLNISVNGSVTAGDNTNDDANVSADQANITASGNIGAQDKPFVTAVDDLSMSGKDIDIHSLTDVTVDNISGKDVDITSDGRVETGTGKTNVTADNLNVDSFGGIGSEDKPLIVNVSGNVNPTTQYEGSYITNIYKKPDPVISGTLAAKMTAKGKKSLVVTWTKIAGAEGYDIFFNKCGSKVYKLIKTVKGGKTLSWTISGLAKGTAYKTIVKAWVMKDGKKVYVSSSLDIHAFTANGNKTYTNAKSVTVKKTSVKLKKGKTYKIKARVKKLKKGKKLMSTKHTAKLRYMSSNSKVVTVTKSGKIKAVGKGTCYVYIFAHNGISKRIKITVK